MPAKDPAQTQISHSAEELSINWPGTSAASRFHAVWLRDNSPAPDNRDPVSGQRLVDAALLPDGIAIRHARLTGDGVDLVFAPDGHATHFSLAFLAAHDHQRLAKPAATHWAGDLQGRIPIESFDRLESDGKALRAWLRAVRDLGIAMIADLPAEPGRIFDAVALFGYVRETNYGRLFDVKAKVDPNNLAYSNLGLGVHTDNPYRDPVPTLQLLHCLSSSAEGGENMVRDGFHAAAQLRQQAPDDFALLTSHEVPFRFADKDAELLAHGRLIEVNGRGEVIAVRYNNRSVAEFDLPPDVMGPFYAAYRRFGRLLHDPAYQVTFKLKPGELFIVDNRRVMHGRKAYSGAGNRHLQGCYADRDGLYSKLAILEREG